MRSRKPTAQDIQLVKRGMASEFGVSLLFDSGAYSAWRKGQTLDLGLYIETLQEIKPYLTAYVTLDVIPGGLGGLKTENIVAESAEKSLANYKKMVKAGLRPMAVYHQGEHWSVLQKYIELGCEYVGISPRGDAYHPYRMKWMGAVFDRLEREYGLDKIRTHGLGLSAAGPVLDFPWYSYDSASWSLLGANGIFVVPPPLPNGVGYDYTRRPVYLIASGGRLRNTPTTRQYLWEAQSPRVQEHCLRYLSDCDISLAEAGTETWARRAINLRYHVNVSRFCALQAKKHGTQGAGLRKYICAVTPGVWLAPLLQPEYHITDRLMSYYHFLMMDNGKLRSIDGIRDKLILYLVREFDAEAYGSVLRSRAKPTRRVASPATQRGLFARSG